MSQRLLWKIEDLYIVSHSSLGHVPAGRVYQDVDPTPVPEQVISGPFEPISIQDIRGKRERLTACYNDLFCHEARFLFAAAQNGYLRSAECKEAGHLTPEHPGSARDDGDLIPEGEEIPDCAFLHWLPPLCPAEPLDGLVRCA